MSEVSYMYGVEIPLPKKTEEQHQYRLYSTMRVSGAFDASKGWPPARTYYEIKVPL